MESPAYGNGNLPFWAALGAAALCISFGANAVAVKLSMAGIGIFTTAGLRFCLAALSILIWARFTRRKLQLKKSQLPPLLILSLTFTLQMAFFYIGLNKTYASRGTLIGNLQPFFVLLLAHFFIPGDRITLGRIIGILMGFIGIAFLFADKHGVSAQLRWGDLFVLCAVMIWAGNTVFIKKLLSQFQAYYLVFYPMVFSGPFFLVLGYSMDHPMVWRLDSTVVSSILYQGLVTASFGFVCWTTLLKKYGAVSLHVYVFLLPISGVILSGLLLSEPVTTFRMIIALVCVSSGIIVVHSRYSTPAVSPSPGVDINDKPGKSCII